MLLNVKNMEDAAAPDGKRVVTPLFIPLQKKKKHKKMFEPILIYVKAINLCLLCNDSQGHFQRQSKTYADVTSLADKPT